MPNSNSNKKRPKLRYQYQRVEQRKMNNVDEKGQKERRQMERMSQRRISIGTFTFFKPKPTSKIRTFTLAFSKPLPKGEVYSILERIFNEKMSNKNLKSEKMIKSVFVSLKKPIQFKEIRKVLRQNFEKIL